MTIPSPRWLIGSPVCELERELVSATPMSEVSISGLRELCSPVTCRSCPRRYLLVDRQSASPAPLYLQATSSLNLKGLQVGSRGLLRSIGIAGWWDAAGYRWRYVCWMMPPSALGECPST